MHGDSLCTRAMATCGYYAGCCATPQPVRSAQPPTRHCRKLARKLRNESRTQTRMKASDIIDVTPELIPGVLAEHRVRTLIHGHTHRPATHDLEVDGQPAKRIVLGDWDRQGGHCRWMKTATTSAIRPEPAAAGTPL